MEDCRSPKKLLDYEPTYLDPPNFRREGLGRDKAVLRSLGEGPQAYTVAKRRRRR
jgi:hypothetical protein